MTKQIYGGPVVTVAASDTPNELKSSANYVCDGIADDVEIQEALNSNQIGSTLQVSVLLLPGNFVIATKITIPRNSRLMGSGANVTKLSYSGTDVVLAPVAGADFGRISDLQITSTGASGQAIGIPSGCTNWEIHNCYLTSLASDNTPTVTLLGTNARLENCELYGNGLCLSLEAQGGVIVGNILTSIQLNFANYALVTGNSIVGSTGPTPDTSALTLISETRAVIVGNRIRNSTKHGIELQSSCTQNLIQGNTIDFIGVVANNTYDGVFIDSNSDQNYILSNIILGTASARYCVRINNANCDDNWITNNRLQTGVSGTLSDLGTGTITAAGNL